MSVGNNNVRGIITDISRCSIHDGPGVRTVIYFKGCGMRCRWCHNPETLRTEPDIMYNKSKCIKCGRCIEVCPSCHSISGNDMVIDRSKCTHCGRCAQECPTGALSVIGREVTTEEVMREIRKDVHFFWKSGGGVTLSGGECLLQSVFAADILRCCQEEGIHTAIETALFVPWENVQRVLPYVDLFYCDYKIADSDKHLVYTGRHNEGIMDHLRRLSECGKKVIIRIPLIPEVNDTEEEIFKLGSVIGSFGNGIKGVEILKYNYLAVSKYEGIGQKWECFGEEAQSDEKLDNIRSQLRGLVKCEVI